MSEVNLIKLINEGSTYSATDSMTASLSNKMQNFREEMKKEVMRFVYEDLVTTKGSLESLKSILENFEFTDEKVLRGKPNGFGKTTIYEYNHDGGLKIRLSHTIKEDGSGDHISWGYIKKGKVMKYGTGARSLNTFLNSRIKKGN